MGKYNKLVGVSIGVGVGVTVDIGKTGPQLAENLEVLPSKSVCVADKYGKSFAMFTVMVNSPVFSAVISFRNNVPANSSLGFANTSTRQELHVVPTRTFSEGK